MTIPNILVLGGTGKTGRRVASRLSSHGATVRTAARNGADVTFDWDDPATYGPALRGADALYLVTQALRADHADEVAAFLTIARTTGLKHVTLASARGVDQAPPEATPRAIELDLVAREDITHSILRPNWFMQNFSESFFGPAIAASGRIAAPTGESAEAFVDAEDIAEVAVATLLDSDAHAGAEYVLSGPQALTFEEVAEKVGIAIGRPVVHIDLPIEDWVTQQLAAGMAEDYAHLHVMLFEALNAGSGAAITHDVEAVTGHAPRSFDQYAATPEAHATWVRAAA